MAKLHVIQADRGESLFLECGMPPNYILIDGGYKMTYKDHLQNVIMNNNINRLDLVIASHIDNDHIGGLLVMLENRREGTKLIPNDLWHNTFNRKRLEGIIYQLNDFLHSSNQDIQVPQFIESELTGIKEEIELREKAESLEIPINNNFPEKLVQLEENFQPRTDIGKKNLFFYIIGPMKENLEGLENEWGKWFRRHKEEKIIDQSPFNRSSIMVLIKAVEDGNEKSILFTGDGRGDDILSGLEKKRLLEERRPLSVNVL